MRPWHVLAYCLLGLALLVVGLAIATSGRGPGEGPLGLTIACVGVAFLLAVVYSLLPRRPARLRTVDEALVLDGSPWPQRFLLTLALVTTVATVTSLLALRYPEVLASSSGRHSPLSMLGLGPLAGWLWWLVLQGRGRQRLEVRGGTVVHHVGRSMSSVEANRDRVRAGRGRGPEAQQVLVRGDTIGEQLRVNTRVFNTTPDSLVQALREVLPRH